MAPDRQPSTLRGSAGSAEPARLSHLLILAACALPAWPGGAHAAAPDGRLFQPDRAWLERYDSTLVASRVVSEFSYESYDDDSDFYKIENTIRWGIPWRDDHAFGLQALLPVKWTETATDDAIGLGDLELRAGVVGRLAPALRYGLAVNAVIDSATASN